MSKFTLDKLPKKVLAKIDFQTAFTASRCVLAAEQLKLFRKLAGKDLTASEIGKKTGMKGWRKEPFLAVMVGLGLLRKKGDRYSNSPLATKYFIKERSEFWTDIYSKECIEEYQAYSVLDEMLTTGKHFESILGIKRKNYVDNMKDDPKRARAFTYMLYHFHLPHAEHLAKKLRLNNYRNLLDCGGGSGVMSLALLKKNPELNATVLDIENVTNVTNQIIKKQKMSKRMNTIVGDITKKLPTGFDVIMYCDAGNFDNQMMNNVYQALPEKGLFVWADSFFSEDLTEPFGRLMWQLRSPEMWALTKSQALTLVKNAGFKNVRKQQIYNDLWMFTGIK